MAREDGFFDDLARGLADGSITRGFRRPTIRWIRWNQKLEGRRLRIEAFRESVKCAVT
jgi:hypothetical protein